MEKNEWLTTEFQETRAHLNMLAYRIPGSTSEAEVAVQETWCRLNRTESESIENLSGWLTKVVARVCLDMFCARKTKHEEPIGAKQLTLPVQTNHNLETELLVANSVGTALLVVFDTLTPAGGERVSGGQHSVFVRVLRQRTGH
jgi:DNA-directed RNA polymerase specialized sigma24 family protein